MQPGAVAIALVQPGGLPAAWSGADVLDRLRGAVIRRHRDVYFRPLLQAPTLARLSWRMARLRWTYALENRAATIGLLLLYRGKMPWSREHLAEIYEYLQQRISEAGFAEDTAANIDYAIYVALRVAAARVQPPATGEALTPSTLGALVAAATRFELCTGAAALAIEEPSLIVNPLVLREIARLAVDAADGYVRALATLGITLD